MALPFPISPSQTDAKSPVDDNLMDSIRLDLEYLDGLFATGSALFTFAINGELSLMSTYKKAKDTVPLYNEFQPSAVRVCLKKSGLTGQLRLDIRRHAKPNTPIIGIDHQYEAPTQGIANVNPAHSTQSITRSTAQIATQTITLAKAALNIQSIINIGTNLWRYNLNAAPDVDWTGGSVLFAGALNAGNNGTFSIVEINNAGHPSIVVSNASGVAQTTPSGTATLHLYSYNFINPIDTEFAAGEIATFAGHSTANNNGQKTIYKTNQSGNNIWVHNSLGAVQGAAAGSADVNRWKYATLSAIVPGDLTIGEKAKMAGHTTGANNGNFTITALNLGSNNVVVYNPSGAVQGGAAGTISTNRWIYSLPNSPIGSITAGETVQLQSHTSGNNNGVFEVKQVSRGSIDNIVIYNESGVAQVGAVGFTRHTKKIVKFSSDQSLNYNTLSKVELALTESVLYRYSDGKLPYDVLEVNRGGGSNFNIVIDAPLNPSQSSPAGYISIEMKSLFTDGQMVIPVDVTSIEPNQMLNAVELDMVSGLLPEQTPIALYILEIPTGTPMDLSVTLH